VSDYDWGYIPFHYGRWVWIAGRGWAWIPGRTYAPAWVVWRVGDGGYIGWAPMPPTWYWSGGVAVGLWTAPYAAYCFVPTTYVFHHHVHTYVVRDPVVVRQVAATTQTYRPARPMAGGGAGGAPKAAKGSYRPASPSLKEAGVPSQSAPKSLHRPDPRARAFATKSSTGSVRRVQNTAPAGAGFDGRAGGSPRGSAGIGGRADSAPAQRGNPAPSQRSPFAADSTVRRSMPSAARGAGRSAPPGSTFQAPASRPSAPTFHAPSSRPSAPAVSAPSPSRSFSAPRSAPSMGGSRGGGGGFRGGGRR
jgi:hypothetical protein